MSSPLTRSPRSVSRCSDRQPVQRPAAQRGDDDDDVVQLLPGRLTKAEPDGAIVSCQGIARAP